MKSTFDQGGAYTDQKQFFQIMSSHPALRYACSQTDIPLVYLTNVPAWTPSQAMKFSLAAYLFQASPPPSVKQEPDTQSVL